MSKLDGYKAGDRFEATMRGTVTFEPDKDGDLVVQMDSSDVSGYLFAKVASDPHFQITRIEPAFKLGDEVLYLSSSDKAVIVAFLKDGRAVIEYEAGDTTNVRAYDISCLTHA